MGSISRGVDRKGANYQPLLSQKLNNMKILFKFKSIAHVWLFLSWEAIQKIWVDSMKVGKWMCSEEGPSGIVWDPLFSHVEISTNTK